MPALVPTLSSSLAAADALFHSGRVSVARKAYGELLERAQDKSDRATEAAARTMLAWCALRARDVEGARELLREVGQQVDPQHLDTYGRYRRVLARVAVEASEPGVARTEARDYLAWAEQTERGADALDACLLLARLCEVDERVEWLERGIESALRAEAHEDLGRAYTGLAAALDQLEQHAEALQAYEQALRWQRASSDDPGSRPVVAALWCVGAASTRTERWAQAQDHLEQALEGALANDTCLDLVGWIRSDLATVYEASGDEVAARREMIAALEVAHEQDLGALWPERYASMLQQAEHLGLSTR